ncbi:MAG: J domain-containing protein [Deltaproteobacteria bacterium]|nr:J domain-containing protein [Deltaproteobacteria bacterium]
MTRDEALGELGLDASADRDTIRRSYLRLIKTRSPEKDPTGFGKLRVAYDTLRALADGRPPPSTEAEPAPATEASKAPEGAAQDRLESFRREFAALAGDVGPDVPIGIARRAVEAAPDALEARTWLVQALVAAKKEDEAIAALRDAYLQGHAEAMTRLANQFPQALTVKELQLLGPVWTPQELWNLAMFYRSVDPVREGVAGELTLEAAISRGTPPPQPELVLMLLMDLLAKDQLETARRALDFYQAWVDKEGLESGLRETRTGSVWPVLRELAALSDEFPRELRALIARYWMGDRPKVVLELGAWLDAHADQVVGLEAKLAEKKVIYGVMANVLAQFRDPRTKRVKEQAKQQRKQELPGRLRAGFTVIGIAVALAALAAWQLPSGPEERARLASEAQRASLAACHAMGASKQKSGCNALDGFVASAMGDSCPGDWEQAWHVEKVLDTYLPTGPETVLASSNGRARDAYLTALRALCANRTPK